MVSGQPGGGPMDETRIFQAEQIVIKPELAPHLKDYSKAVIRAKPGTMHDLYKVSYDYFLARTEAKTKTQEPVSEE